MHLKKLPAESAQWFRLRAANEGFIYPGGVSLWKFFDAIAAGEFSIVRTTELEKLKQAAADQSDA